MHIARASLLCAFFVFAPWCNAQDANSIDLGRATRLQQLPEWRRRELLWTTQAWTGDDRPYVRIRQAIDKAIASGRSPDALSATYGKAALSNSQNAQAAFRWAYAAWNARKRFSSREEQARRIEKPARALLQVPFPRSYQFARLLFLTQAWNSGLPQFLETTGYKLLRRNSHDYDVKFYMAKLLANSPALAKRQQAIRFTREFIARNPRKASYYSLLGGIYFANWEDSKSSADANNAIAAYRRYLVLAPANDPWRQQAQALINTLQNRNG